MLRRAGLRTRFYYFRAKYYAPRSSAWENSATTLAATASWGNGHLLSLAAAWNFHPIPLDPTVLHSHQQVPPQQAWRIFVTGVVDLSQTSSSAIRAKGKIVYNLLVLSDSAAISMAEKDGVGE
jgi:hypothetical protein